MLSLQLFEGRQLAILNSFIWHKVKIVFLKSGIF